MANPRFLIPAASPASPHVTELVVRKSRFAAQTCHCLSRTEALAFLEGIRKARPDSTHNCWAFAAGAPGDSSRVGSSDDGEPRGTAGRPMLNVLLHSGIGQICVVVSRWFGGIKLGVGGLVRAYQDATLENLASLPVCEAVTRATCRLMMPYACAASVRRGLDALEAVVESETYAELVTLVFKTPEEHLDAVATLAANASNGAATLQIRHEEAPGADGAAPDRNTAQNLTPPGSKRIL